MSAKKYKTLIIIVYSLVLLLFISDLVLLFTQLSKRSKENTDESHNPQTITGYKVEIVFPADTYKIKVPAEGKITVGYSGSKDFLEGVLFTCVSNKALGDELCTSSNLSVSKDVLYINESLKPISKNEVGTVGFSDTFGQAGEYKYTALIYNCDDVRTKLASEKCDATIDEKKLKSIEPSSKTEKIIKVTE